MGRMHPTWMGSQDSFCKKGKCPLMPKGRVRVS